MRDSPLDSHQLNVINLTLIGLAASALIWFAYSCACKIRNVGREKGSLTALKIRGALPLPRIAGHSYRKVSKEGRERRSPKKGKNGREEEDARMMQRVSIAETQDLADDLESFTDDAPPRSRSRSRQHHPNQLFQKEASAASGIGGTQWRGRSGGAKRPAMEAIVRRLLQRMRFHLAAGCATTRWKQKEG